METRILPIDFSDISKVNHLYEQVFIKNRSGLLRITPAKIRDDFFWNLYLKKNGPYSFYMEMDKKMIGFSFAHFLGNWCWFGPLGIHPQYQGGGFGKKLLGYQMERVNKKSKMNFILESNSNVSNVGFYSSLNFNLIDTRFRLLIYSSRIKNHSVRFHFKKISLKEFDGLALVKRLDEKYGLKFDTEINSYLDEKVGKIYWFSDGKTEGCVFFVSKPTYLRENPFVNIKFMTVNENDPLVLRDILYDMALSFFKKGYSYLLISLAKKNINIVKHIHKEVGKLIYYNFVFERGKHLFPCSEDEFYSFSWAG